jgi:hypothetical protein
MEDLRIGVFIGLFIAGVFGVLAFNSKKSKKGYDERQLAVRGRGYTYAYFTVMILSILHIFTKDMISLPVSNELISLIILFISGIVLNIYIVFHDAYYIYKNNNCKKHFIAYIFIFLLNGGYLIRSIVDHTLFKDGVLQFREGINLIVAISFIVLILNLVVKLVIDRYKKEEE